MVQPEAGGTERLWVIFTQVYFYSGFVKLWGSIPTYIVHTLAYLKRKKLFVGTNLIKNGTISMKVGTIYVHKINGTI